MRKTYKKKKHKRKFDRRYIEMFIEGCDILGVHPMLFCKELERRGLEADIIYLRDLITALSDPENYSDPQSYKFVSVDAVIMSTERMIVEASNNWPAQKIIEKLIIDLDGRFCVAQIRNKRKLYTIEELSERTAEIDRVINKLDMEAREILHMLTYEYSSDKVKVQVSNYLAIFNDLGEGIIKLETGIFDISETAGFLSWYRMKDADEAELRKCDLYLKRIENLMDRYSMPIMYCNFVLWRVWGDDNAQKNLIDCLNALFDGNMFPVNAKIDVKGFMKQNRCENINESLAKWVISICSFIEDYSVVIGDYTDKHSINQIPVRKYIEYDEHELKDHYSQQYFIRYIDEIGGIDNYLKALNGLDSYDIDDSGIVINRAEVLSSLSDDEKKETGEFAFRIVCNTIDLMYLTKLLLREFEQEEIQYKVIRYMLAGAIDRIVTVIFNNKYVYEDSAIDIKVERTIDRLKEDDMVSVVTKLMLLIHKKDIEALLQCKNDLWSRLSVTEKSQERIQEVIETIVNELKLEVENLPEYDSHRSRLKECCVNVSEDILNTLSTAEYLFDEFIVKRNEKDGFDYSFISILYYQALEELLNVLFYIPYIESIDIASDLSFCFENPSYYFRNGRLKTSIEMGTLGHFLYEADNTKLHEFIQSRYPRVNIARIKKIGEIIKEYIAERRNNAAHTETLSYNEAMDDKVIVYMGEKAYHRQVLTRDMFKQVMQLVDN